MRSQKLSEIKCYTIDLTRMKGRGNVKCPGCGSTISPDDETEDAYTILETGMNQDRLERIIVQCSKCFSRIHLTGFDFLDRIWKTICDINKDETADFCRARQRMHDVALFILRFAGSRNEVLMKVLAVSEIHAPCTQGRFRSQKKKRGEGRKRRLRRLSPSSIFSRKARILSKISESWFRFLKWNISCQSNAIKVHGHEDWRQMCRGV